MVGGVGSSSSFIKYIIFLKFPHFVGRGVVLAYLSSLVVVASSINNKSWSVAWLVVVWSPVSLVLINNKSWSVAWARRVVIDNKSWSVLWLVVINK